MSPDELTIRSLEAQLAALGTFLHTVAAALGVGPEPFGGIAEANILKRIDELQEVKARYECRMGKANDEILSARTA